MHGVTRSAGIARMLSHPNGNIIQHGSPRAFLGLGSGDGWGTRDRGSVYERYAVSVVNDARKSSLGGATREGLLDKLAGEFQAERVSATRRAEDKLRLALASLQDRAGGAEAFNLKRMGALKLRSELIIQREVCGIVTGTAGSVEREFPVPAAM